VIQQSSNIKQGELDERGMPLQKTHNRKVKKSQNEQGLFRRLLKEIEEMANEHNMELNKALELFENCSGDK